MTTATSADKEREEVDQDGLRRWTVALLILKPVLMVLTFFVLSAAINWPASLGEPASVNLPLMIEQRGAVVVGYGAYLAYSFLILPLSVMLYFLLKDRGAPSPLLAVAAAVGVVSALARALGIVRWLFVMPFLAEIYLDKGSSQAMREAVEVAYVAFNEYAGGVGELFGVSLTGALWVGLVSVAILRSARFPKWLGILGLLTAALLLPGVLSVVGIDAGTLFATVGVLSFLAWMLALAGVLIFSRRPYRRTNRRVS